MDLFNAYPAHERHSQNWCLLLWTILTSLDFFMILFVNADKHEFIKGVSIKNSLKKLVAGEKSLRIL